MSNSGNLFERANRKIQQLGLREIPFSEAPPGLLNRKLHSVFTGRDGELKQVANLFLGSGIFDLRLPLRELDPDSTYQMLVRYLDSARIGKSVTDPEDPASVRPFLPETARAFCAASLGRPRLFNRLGIAVPNKAIALEADTITPKVLHEGLKSAEYDLRQKAALTAREMKVHRLLEQRKLLSEEATMEDLLEAGFRTFGELLPILEHLQEADLSA